MKISIVTVLFFVISPLCAQPADSTRIRTTASMLGIGSTEILDTYLSQEKFSGTGISFLNITEWQNAGSRWSTVVQQEANLSTTNDRSDKADELQGDYGLFWGRYYDCRLPGDRLRLQAGGLLNGNLGFIYNTVNSNNPAQARLSAQLMPSLIASYALPLPSSIRRHFRRPPLLRYELDLPLAGLMFSPNYGQSYYEIFSQGHYDHNLVPTTFLSAPTFRQQLSLDWNFARSWTLRVGYLGHYQQAEVNNLKSHVYHHRVMIGVVRRFQTLFYRP